MLSLRPLRYSAVSAFSPYLEIRTVTPDIDPGSRAAGADLGVWPWFLGRVTAESAEGLVRYGIPLMSLSTILILRRRDSAVSKDGAGSRVLTEGSPFETLRSSG